jgi:hypothetical protein
MESSKKITSIMIAVAIVTLAALAISTDWNSKQGGPSEIALLPGLGENLNSVERITGHPRQNFRSVIVTRSTGEELTMVRESLADPEFQYLNGAPLDPDAYSAILFSYASFLNALASADAFAVVADHTEEHVFGRLKYTSFDGLALEFVVYTAAGDTWLRMIAADAPKLAERFADAPSSGLRSSDEVKQTAHELNGRVYKGSMAGISPADYD